MTHSYRVLGSSVTRVDYENHLTSSSWEDQEARSAIEGLEKAIPRLVERLKHQSLWDRCCLAVGRLPTVYMDLKREVEGAFRKFPATPPPSEEVCQKIASLAQLDKAVQKCMLASISLRQDSKDGDSLFFWESLRICVLVGE